MKTNPPIAMTFHEFRHIHRALLPGESLPRLPTLGEQLQVLRGAPLLPPAPAAQDNAPEAEEGDDEDWPETP